MGDIYIQRTTGKAVRLYKAGSFNVARELVSRPKYHDLLVIEEKRGSDNSHVLRNLMNKFLKSEDILTKANYREKILVWVKRHLWEENQEMSFLELLNVGDECFFDLKEEEANKMYDTHCDYFLKAAIEGQ